jgi:hypothetical protein
MNGWSIVPSMPGSRALSGLLVVVAASSALGVGCIGVSQKRGGPGATAFKMCRAGTRPAEDGLVDDFEDSNTQVTIEGGRDGYWWSAHDEKGSTIGPDPFAPSEGGADGPGMSMRGNGTTTTAPGDDSWGAQFGVNFLAANGSFYDASRYVGVSFKARVADNGDEKSARHVRFKIGDVNTHVDGHVCTTKCWNHFGKDLVLSPKWKEYTILFSEAKQEDGWGDPRPQAVTPSKLINLNWSVKGGGPYDIWVDDVTFVDCK